MRNQDKNATHWLAALLAVLLVAACADKDPIANSHKADKGPVASVLEVDKTPENDFNRFSTVYVCSVASGRDPYGFMQGKVDLSVVVMVHMPAKWVKTPEPFGGQTFDRWLEDMVHRQMGLQTISGHFGGLECPEWIAKFPDSKVLFDPLAKGLRIQSGNQLSFDIGRSEWTPDYGGGGSE